MFPSVPCPVSKCSTSWDKKAKYNWNSPLTSPEHHQEESSSLMYAVDAGCEYQASSQKPLHCTSAKIHTSWVHGAKQVHQPPLQCIASPSLPSTEEGPRQRLMLGSNRWMVTRWNRLSGEMLQFPALKVSKVSSSSNAQWICNSSFHEQVKTLPQLSKQHAKDKLLFFCIFSHPAGRNIKIWDKNEGRKEESSASPNSSVLPRL